MFTVMFMVHFIIKQNDDARYVDILFCSLRMVMFYHELNTVLNELLLYFSLFVIRIESHLTSTRGYRIKLSSLKKLKYIFTILLK